MSHSSNVFSRVPIDLPNRSGFNLDHENLFSATCGTLIPAYAKPVLPKDTMSMGVNFQVQLPPFVTDFYGKVDAVFEAFFVPNRLLWGGWKSFITHPTSTPVYPTGTPIAARPSRVPLVSFPPGATGVLGAGSLADYVGLKKESYGDGITGAVTALPFLAYHMIYDHWYRDTRIQSPVFYEPAASNTSAVGPASCPYVSTISASVTTGPIYQIGQALGDGVSLGSLRQRNWSKGYFTTASPYPQGGEAEEISIDVVDNEGVISMAALRSANAIQQWKERFVFSYEYGDQMYAQYGIYPDSEVIDKPIFLGRTKQTVYSRSVMQTTSGLDFDDDGGSGLTMSNRLGGKAANGQAIGEGSLFENFTPSEHGFIMVLFSLVPHAYYGTGVARHLFELESEDVPFPLLAGTGDQRIYKFELTGNVPLDWEQAEVFGFTDRYAHYKYDEDEVHGLLRDGQSLENFALQRGFGGLDDEVELGSEFLQIPMNALDQVMQISTGTLGTTCWLDSFFKISKISTLPAYSLPTLGDIKNTHKGYVSRGGSRL